MNMSFSMDLARGRAFASIGSSLKAITYVGRSSRLCDRMAKSSLLSKCRRNA